LSFVPIPFLFFWKMLVEQYEREILFEYRMLDHDNADSFGQMKNYLPRAKIWIVVAMAGR